MSIRRGYKFKLRPTADQEAFLSKHAGVCRLVYNLALEQRRDHYRQFLASTGKHISFASQSAELTALRAEFDWIRGVTQTAQVQALRDLDRAYQNFFAGVSGYPTPRKKGVNDSFRFLGREVAFRRLNKSWGMVKLPKIGEVRFRWTRDISGKIKNATISLDPLGWHVSFSTEAEVEAEQNFGPAVGIDRGVVEAVAYSDGNFADFPKALIRKLGEQAKRADRALSRCRRNSNRRKVAQAIADAQIGYERDRVSRGLASGKAAEHWEPATMRWDLMARAAIEAMREPTKAMWEAGTEAIEEKREYDRDSYEERETTKSSDQAVPCFQAMIDAALKEGK